jgi:phosphoribosyl 1,2-cyclic phosphate phosphodiesterase
MSDRPVKQVFTILGCGSSQGVPRSDGDWGACDPKNPKNNRRRASFMIEQISETGGKTTVVIDTGPDFREQMISAKVQHIDGVIYTHLHGDHTHGIIDLRGFFLASGRPVPIYTNAATLAHLNQQFGFCLNSKNGNKYPPIASGHVIEDLDAPLVIDGAGGPISIQIIEQVHGPITSLGVRVGNVAYCSDVSEFPNASIDKLQGLDTLIIDATLLTPHFSHFSLDQAVEWAQTLGAKQAYTTHMHVPLDYDDVMARTPDNIAPAYDGMQFEQILT